MQGPYVSQVLPIAAYGQEPLGLRSQQDNGRTWVPDPRAATTLDSGYGGADSILDLTL